MHLVKLLMDVAEQDGLLLRMTSQHGEQVIGILEIVLIQPGAAHRYRLMVQGDKGVAIRILAQGTVEGGQLVITDHAVRFAAHLGVEQDHLPVVAHQLFGFADPGGMEIFGHQRAVIVIARQPVDGATEGRHHGGETLIGFRTVILRQIAGRQNHLVGVFIDLHLFQHGGQTLCGAHSQQPPFGTREEVGVGNLQQAHTAVLRLGELCFQNHASFYLFNWRY